MAVEPLWLEAHAFIETHDEQIQLFGGLQGIRDAGLIESALGSVRNVYHYEGETDILRLAAHLALALARNHAFADGNKRTAFSSMLQFMALDGYTLEMPNTTLPGEMFERAVASRQLAGSLAESLAPFVRRIS